MFPGSEFVPIANGTSIGRKRIVVLDNVIEPIALRLELDGALQWPVAIAELAAFAPCTTPE